MRKDKVKDRNRAYKVRKIADYTVVVLLCTVLLFIWQLYREPIAVPFLKPYIIKALNHDSQEYEVTVESVNLELVRSIKPIKIIANNVIYKRVDETIVINAPKASVSFSLRAILRGIVAPSSIEVMRPSIYVFTTYGVDKTKENKEEEITKKKIEYYLDSFDVFMERFNSEDKIYPESYINDIAIKNAEVEFHEVDLGRKWTLSDVNYTFERNLNNIETDFNALIKLKEKAASFGLEAEFRPQSNKVALRVYFTDIIPADVFNNFLDEQDSKKIYQVELPISGNIEALVNLAEVEKNKKDVIHSLDTAIENIKFAFEGGNGKINFSEDQSYNYDVSSFILEGHLDSGLDNLKIEDADFDLGAQKAKVSIDVSGMKKYLLQNSLDDLKVMLKADIPFMDFDDLSKYWPKYIAQDAWEWCKESISGGNISDASFTFDFAYDKGFEFKGLKGQGKIVNSNLYYLEGMPTVTGLYGDAEFHTDYIQINVEKGISQGVELTGGYVKLYDLDKEDNFAEIKLLANSSITDALRMIDNKPLEYAKEMGVKPETVKGLAETDLLLNFELKQNLLPSEVKVDVKAKLKDIEIDNIVKDKNVKSQELNLEVTNNGMIIQGDAVLDGINMGLLWKEDFSSKDYKSKYTLSFKLNDEVKKKLGINSDILNPPYIEGYADVIADITTFENEKIKIDLNASLKNAKIDYSFLGFRKPINEDASIKAEINLVKDKIQSVPSFGLSKTDFDLKGRLDLDVSGNIKTVDIFSIKGSKTDAQALINFTPAPKESIDIKVTGQSYDLTDFFTKHEDEAKEKAKAKSKTDAAAKKDKEDDWEKVTDTDVFIQVNKLWTNPKVAVRNVTGTATLRHGIGVNEVHLIGNYGTKRDVILRLDYVPRPNNEFLLSVDSNNAGSTLKVLRLYDHMKGGNLYIEAKRNKDKEFIGHAKIRDFSIHNTPVLAKVLTVASLTGMVNLLTGEGMTFTHFDAPFDYKEDILGIHEAKAFGSVMGITASGYYNRLEDSLKIKGMIAPAYTINKFLGNIPIVGGLLAGKDGTIFAANYSIRGNISDPDVNINPLSALSPNSIKDVFSNYGDQNEY